MGYAYCGLIPAAILLDNPNITREEFARKLEGIGFSNYREFSKYAKWKSCTNKYIGSLSELSELIGIDYSKEFKESQKEKRDGNNLPIFPPKLLPFRKNLRY